MGTWIELTAADGVTIKGYRADPAGKTRGGLVVVQEIFGVNSHIRAVCDGFAADGYLAVAPAILLPGFSCAVAYYGGGMQDALGEKPKVPVLGHFGRKDQHIPVDGIRKLAAATPSMEVHFYDADHGFNCDQRGSFDAAAAKLARERTVNFLREHVG